MTKVFISGSRMISRLNADVSQRLENIINRGFEVITGDANGVDKAIQRFFFERNYPDVTIYHVGPEPRNNIGKWRSIEVDVHGHFRGRDLYTQKDKRMAEVADYGMIIWDGQSSGSVQNMIWLVSNHKSALVFKNQNKSFHTISNTEDIVKLMNEIDPLHFDEIDRKISIKKFLKGEKEIVQAAFDL